MNSKGKIFGIAENTGLLKHHLWKHNIDTVLVPPTVIKKSFTGYGHTKKVLMEEEFKKRTCLDLRKVLKLTNKQENPVSDIVDSFSLGDYAYKELKG